MVETDRRGRPEGLIIHARQQNDAQGLTQLVNLPGFRFGTMRLPFHSLQEVAGWIEKAPATNVELVAEMEGQIVGQGGLYRFTGRQAHVGGLGMGVHDAWTGQGIGTALLTALLDAADNWLGIRRLQLTVYVDNAPAIHLYERSGFGVEGTHKAYALRDGRYADAHTMARLGGADPLDFGDVLASNLNTPSNTISPVVRRTENVQPLMMVNALGAVSSSGGSRTPSTSR